MSKERPLSSYFEDWIETFKKPIIHISTYKKYITSLAVLKQIEELDNIHDYDRIAYQRLINRYAETRSITTVKDFHRMLHCCIKDLVDDNIIARDFCLKVKFTGLPKPKRNKFLEEDEIKKLLSNMNLSRNELNFDHFIYLLLVTGMRFAECLALTPKDFDFQRLTINIDKTFDYKNLNGKKKEVNTAQFMPTKTQSSIRVISMDYKTVYLMEELIKPYPEDQAIFPYWYKQKAGGMIYNATINDHLERLCRNAGIKKISVHGLRHTHASWLLANEIDMQAVSKRLGHAKLSITQDVYTHLLDSAEQKANSAIGALMVSL